jgi:hypothetical protein
MEDYSLRYAPAAFRRWSPWMVFLSCMTRWASPAPPNLNFRGDARQALEFYHSVFGGQLMIATEGQAGRGAVNALPVPLAALKAM